MVFKLIFELQANDKLYINVSETSAAYPFYPVRCGSQHSTKKPGNKQN